MNQYDPFESQLSAFFAGVVLTVIGVFLLVLVGVFIYFSVVILRSAIS